MEIHVHLGKSFSCLVISWFSITNIVFRLGERSFIVLEWFFCDNTAWGRVTIESSFPFQWQVNIVSSHAHMPHPLTKLVKIY